MVIALDGDKTLPVVVLVPCSGIGFPGNVVERGKTRAPAEGDIQQPTKIYLPCVPTGRIAVAVEIKWYIKLNSVLANGGRSPVYMG
jgi:hypothetical protein